MIAKEIQIPKFPPDIYSRIALNDLVTYAVFFLSQHGGEINAEDIVAACFKLFPERFQLRGYSEWPDSTVVNKRWLDCRDKGLLHGSTAGGFLLTAKGLELAEKTSGILTGKQRLFRKPGLEKVSGEMRIRARRFVKSLETSEAFQKYSAEGPLTNVSEFDFRDMLLCTIESSATTLRNNLEQFRQFATLCRRADLVGFLNECQRKFGWLLVVQRQRRFAGVF
ncbi:MAG: hypothetical protein ABSC01_09990 [Verrucomicrobiota bacterium]|jgi:hypothetical protein